MDGDLAPDALQYPVLNAVAGSWATAISPGPVAAVRSSGEADGRDAHTTTEALFHDRRRANNFILSSCDIVRFTWADALRPVYIQQIVRSAPAAA